MSFFWAFFALVFSFSCSEDYGKGDTEFGTKIASHGLIVNLNSPIGGLDYIFTCTDLTTVKVVVFFASKAFTIYIVVSINGKFSTLQ